MLTIKPVNEGLSEIKLSMADANMNASRTITPGQRHIAKLRNSGGKIIAVRLYAEQLAALNALQMPGESRQACVIRLIEQAKGVGNGQ